MTKKKAAKDKLKTGRPALFKNVRELQEKIDEYFESCWIDKVVEVTDKEGNVTATNSRYQARPYTVMGLVLALGFNSRKSLSDYKAKPEFINAIKRARSKIEMNVEEALIFWLKNNAEEKYRDKTELEHTGKDGESLPGVNIGVLMPMERITRVAYILQLGLERKKKAELVEHEKDSGQ